MIDEEIIAFFLVGACEYSVSYPGKLMEQGIADGVERLIEALKKRA